MKVILQNLTIRNGSSQFNTIVLVSQWHYFLATRQRSRILCKEGAEWLEADAFPQIN